MQCHAFENRLNDLLDRRLRPEYDGRLVAHARNCPRCGETLAIQHMVLADVAASSTDQTPDMAPSVVSRLWPARVESRSLRRVWSRWVVATLATSLALAAIPPIRGWLFSRAQTQVSSVAPPVVVAPSDNLPISGPAAPIIEQGEPVAGLARGLGQSMARGMVHVPGVTSAVGPITLIEPVVLPEELAEQLGPLRPLAAAVVNLLRKSLPRLGERPDARSSSVVDLRQSIS